MVSACCCSCWAIMPKTKPPSVSRRPCSGILSSRSITFVRTSPTYRRDSAGSSSGSAGRSARGCWNASYSWSTVSGRIGSRPPTSRSSQSSSWLPMWARSHTNGDINRECWRASSLSSNELGEQMGPSPCAVEIVDDPVADRVVGSFVGVADGPSGHRELVRHRSSPHGSSVSWSLVGASDAGVDADVIGRTSAAVGPSFEVAVHVMCRPGLVASAPATRPRSAAFLVRRGRSRDRPFPPAPRPATGQRSARTRPAPDRPPRHHRAGR